MRRKIVLLISFFISFSSAVPPERCLLKDAELCHFFCPSYGEVKFEFYWWGGCERDAWYCPNIGKFFSKSEMKRYISSKGECPTIEEFKSIQNAVRKAEQEKEEKKRKAECDAARKKAEPIVKRLQIKRDEYVKKYGGSFTDRRDGKTYKTISIGNCEWMAENLDYGRDESCENGVNDCKTKGRTYNWEDAANACPEGWRLPSKIDFMQLFDIALNSNCDKTRDWCVERENVYKLHPVPSSVDNLLQGRCWLPLPRKYGTDEFGFSASPPETFWSGSIIKKASTSMGTVVFELTYDYAELKTNSLNSKNFVRCVKKSKTEEDFQNTYTDERDGHEYKLILIDGRTWMAENLNYDCGSTECFCYENKHYKCKKYGRIYTRKVLQNGNEVCPKGFRLPSVADFENMIDSYKYESTLLKDYPYGIFKRGDNRYSQFNNYFHVRCLKD